MGEPNRPPQGTNLRILFDNCQCPDEYLQRFESTVEAIQDAITSVGFQILSYTGHQFQGGGYTTAFILAESHVIVHTWPEINRSVIIDISVCNYSRPNHQRTLLLGKRFPSIFNPEKSIKEIMPMSPRMSNQVCEGLGHYVEVEQLISSRTNSIHQIEIAHTSTLGRVLVLDGVLQTSEKDDFYYHEPLVHVPLLSLRQPKHVLICGGGDGGAAKEVIKHPSIKSCTIIDIDPDVIELAQRDLRAIHQGVFDDPRVQVVIQDASEYVQDIHTKFDVIIMDTTDPGEIADVLFTKEFLDRAFSILEKNGCLVLHLGSPYHMNPSRYQTVSAMQSIFEKVYAFMNFVPCFGTMLEFLIGMKGTCDLVAPAELEYRLQERNMTHLEFLTPETYRALFTIPPCLQNMNPPTDVPTTVLAL